MGFFWTEERVKEAAKLWDDGRTTDQIAQHFGKTRNAVAGIIMRERDMFAPRTVTGRPRIVPQVSPIRPRTPRVKVEKPTIQVFEGVGQRTSNLSTYRLAGIEPVLFVDLTSTQCRFPLETFEERSGPDKPCCGALTDSPHGYCTEHRKIMWTPMPARKVR